MADGYFKLTNIGATPVLMTYTIPLLTDEETIAFENFKESSDYLGETEEDKMFRKSVPTVIKMRLFVESLAHDVRVKMYDNTAQGRVPRYEWQFSIGPDPKAFAKIGLLKARKIAEKFNVAISSGDTEKEIAEKFTKTFGPNVRVVNGRQWNESGLKNFEQRKIFLKLQPGQLKQRIIEQGGLIALPISEEEALGSDAKDL